MRPGGAVLAREDRYAALREGRRKLARQGDHLGGIGPPEVAPIQHRHRQRRRFRGIEIRRHARKGDGIEPLGHLAVICHDQPPRRTAKALVGAHGHQMRAFRQRVRPGLARNDPALMRGVEQEFRANLVRDGAHLCDGVFIKVQAAADGDQLRLFGPGQPAQAVEVDRIAVALDRCRKAAQPEQPRAAGGVMGDMPADAGRRRDDRIARLAGGHEAVKVGDGPRRHADLGVSRVENLGTELRGDDLDFLDGLEPHLVLVARIAQRGARADARGQQRLGAGVHDVRRRVEVEAQALVDFAVFRGEALQPRKDLGRLRDGGAAGDLLDAGFTLGRHPVTMGKCHALILCCWAHYERMGALAQTGFAADWRGKNETQPCPSRLG